MKRVIKSGTLFPKGYTYNGYYINMSDSAWNVYSSEGKLLGSYATDTDAEAAIDEGDTAENVNNSTKMRFGANMCDAIESSSNIKASMDPDDIHEITSSLVRSISGIKLSDIELVIEDDGYEFSNYDWAAYNGDGEHEVDWPSDEDDPEIPDLDYTSEIADKVYKLFVTDVLNVTVGSPESYGTYKINSASVDLTYVVPDATYSVTGRGYYESGYSVDYNVDEIYWSEADSTIECDYVKE